VYQTTTFTPRIRFSVPAGWSSTYDVPGQFDLAYDAGGQHTYVDGSTFSDRISIFANPVAQSPTVAAPLPGVGTSAADLTAWLVAHDDLVASTPRAVSIGGAAGFVLDVALPTGAHTSPDYCTTQGHDARCESLFVSGDSSSSFSFGLFGPETVVLYLLDAPSSGTVMVVVDDVDGGDGPGLVDAATPIVESIGFAP
jgi:hypothetical protein